MAHFAKIDFQTNVVLEVHVVNNSDINDLPFPDSESIGIEFLEPWSTPGTYWKQTSYNGNFRKNYAYIDGTYDDQLDAFIEQKPYPSWILSTSTFNWEAPISKPTDGKLYVWDEPTLSWKELVNG